MLLLAGHEGWSRSDEKFPGVSLSDFSREVIGYILV